MTVYPNTRPAESWEQCAAHLDEWGDHGGTVLIDGYPSSFTVTMYRAFAAEGCTFTQPSAARLLRWPDPPHPGLHSPEVMHEDDTTEPCPNMLDGLHRMMPSDECPDCEGRRAVTVPGRSFVAWHTLGATIPEGWERRVCPGEWWRLDPRSTTGGADPNRAYLVREPLTPPVPRGTLEVEITADTTAFVAAMERVNAAMCRRVDPPEGAPAPCTCAGDACDEYDPDDYPEGCRYCAALLADQDCPQGGGEGAPARVEPPSGVQVIGWTEPTDDEPRSLPIVDPNDVPDGWVVADTLYVIRPVPVPPAPETERVPWWEAPGRRLPHGELIGPIHHAYPVAGHSGGMYVEYHLPERDTTGNPQRGEADGTVEVLVEAPKAERLPLDGTDD